MSVNFETASNPETQPYSEADRLQLEQQPVIPQPRHSDQEQLRPFHEVLHEAQQGDPAAFADIWRRCETSLLGTAGRIVGYGRAEDITQTVALRAVSHLEDMTLHPDPDATESFFRAWLRRIAINASLDVVRRDARIKMHSIDAADPQTDAPHMNLLVDFTAQESQERVLATSTVSQALGHLAPEFREAIQAVDIDGLKYDEYAVLSGVRVGTVRSRLHRGRKQLRELIEAGKIEGLAAPRH